MKIIVKQPCNMISIGIYLGHYYKMIYKEDNKMIVELHTLPRTRFDSGYTSPNKEIEVTIIDTSNPDILANLTDGELWLVNKVITEETTITIGNTIATLKRG